MSELKPCPFCGGEAKYVIKCHSERGITRGWEFGIHCTECGVTTPKTYYKLEVQLSDNGQINTIEDERYQAIEAWNRRAELIGGDYTIDTTPVVHGHWKEKRKYEVGAAVDDDGWLELEELCSVCGKWVKTQWRSPLYCSNCGAKMDEVSK